MGMNVQTVDLLHAISISVGRMSGPLQAGVRTVEFELRFLPYGWARPDGNPHCPDGCRNLPLFELGKKSEAIRSLRVVWMGCWDVRTDASWNRSFSMQRRVWTKIHIVRTDDALVCQVSGRYGTSSGRLELWTNERPDGMARRPDGWQGTEISDLQTVQNLLKYFWIVESLLKSIFTYNWFCPIRMRPITN
jgi:hypothetical protein